MALFISRTVSGDVPIARNHCMTPNCLSILKVLKKNTPQKLTKAKDAFISLYKHVKKNPGGYTPFTIDWQKTFLTWCHLVGPRASWFTTKRACADWQVEDVGDVPALFASPTLPDPWIPFGAWPKRTLAQWSSGSEKLEAASLVNMYIIEFRVLISKFVWFRCFLSGFDLWRCFLFFSPGEMSSVLACKCLCERGALKATISNFFGWHIATTATERCWSNDKSGPVMRISCNCLWMGLCAVVVATMRRRLSVRYWKQKANTTRWGYFSLISVL